MNNLNYNDLKNICRTCLLNCDINFKQDPIILDTFYKLTNIRFDTNDELPKQICRNCFQKINDIHAFAFQCIRAHTSLMSFLNNYKQMGIHAPTNIQGTGEVIKIEEVTTDEEDNRDNFINEENTIEDISINYHESIINENGQNMNFKMDPIHHVNIKMNTSETTTTTRKMYKCNLCDKTYQLEKSLKRHLDFHREDKPSVCGVCNRMLSSVGALKSHMRVHGGEGERPYKCDECAKAFLSPSHLRVHKAVHSGERPFGCDECSMAFTRANHLLRHKYVHSGEGAGTYRCSLCPKQFSRSGSLYKHRKKHTGVYAFKCGQCPMTFTQEINLRRHVGLHSGSRRHQCHVCSYKFTRLANLRRHMKIHEKEA